MRIVIKSSVIIQHHFSQQEQKKIQNVSNLLRHLRSRGTKPRRPRPPSHYQTLQQEERQLRQHQVPRRQEQLLEQRILAIEEHAEVRQGVQRGEGELVVSTLLRPEVLVEERSPSSHPDLTPQAEQVRVQRVRQGLPRARQAEPTYEEISQTGNFDHGRS
jgi:hypothetical protein